MAKINNSQVIQKLVDELKLYPSKDAIPTELAEKILPVFTINESEVNVSIQSEATYQSIAGTGASTLTIPSGKKWRVKHLSIKWVGDATAGNRAIGLEIKDSAGNIIFHIDRATATAASQTGYTHFQLGAYHGGGDGEMDTGFTFHKFLPFPTDITLLENWTMVISDGNAVSGSDTNQINIEYEESDI